MPAYLASPVMSGVGSGMPTTVTTAGAAGPTGAMQTTPMAMGGRGAQGGMPEEMTRRGGENPHVVQSRPRVVPRTQGG